MAQSGSVETFYDVVTHQRITVDATDVTTRIFSRTTRSGSIQERYAVQTRFGGRRLSKSVSKAAINAFQAALN